MNTTVQIKRLHENDHDLLSDLVDLFNEVFEEGSNKGSKAQLKKLLQKPDFHAIVAFSDGGVIGGATAYELERYYNDKRELFIYDIAVKTAFHNKGIGKSLMNYLKTYGQETELECIFVEAMADEDQANMFYKSTIGEGANVIQYTIEI